MAVAVIRAIEIPGAFFFFVISNRRAGPRLLIEDPIARDCSGNASLNDRALTSRGSQS